MKHYIWQENDEVDHVDEITYASKKSVAFQYTKAALTNYGNFVMLGIVLDEPQDWSIFCQCDYSIMCNIDMANINALTFQLKTLNNGIMCHDSIIEKIPCNQKSFNVKLNRGNLKKMKAVKEICFLAFNSDIKDGDCSFTIANLRIEKNQIVG